METGRKPFQGLINIIRFNWHFYVIAIVALIALMLFKNRFPPALQSFVIFGAAVASFTIIVSLLVSFYIYDLSGLYQLKWLPASDNNKVLTINAGFDETSEILERKFNNIDLTICDFYNPEKHTEISIKRARLAYPPHPKTIAIPTDHLPFADNTFDQSLAILSAHEIRDEKERIQFFKELRRVTKPSGQIWVTEHLRDWNNFLAYTIGFMHFHSKASWLNTFQQAHLTVKKETKSTPFITTFLLENNGNTL